MTHPKPVAMHRIQKYILAQLAVQQTCRFSQLRPKDVESNHLMYHLRRLMASGWVNKSAGAYALTPTGLLEVDRLSSVDSQPRIQPKIVTLIACSNEAGEWLVYRRARQPFKGLVGFPYGKIHLGEKVGAAAKREFKEKTGVDAALTHRGEVYLTVHDKEGELISHMLTHVFSGKVTGGTLREASEMGKCFWQDVKKLPAKQFFPGFKEELALLSKGEERFFEEYTFTV